MARTDQPIYYKARLIPQKKILIDRLGLTDEQAQKVQNILNGTTDLMTIEAARERQWEAYNDHEPLTLALEALNELLEGFGVEYIRHEDDGYAVGDQYGIEYVNQGDTYAATIMYDHARNCWRVGDWGSIVERSSKYV